MQVTDRSEPPARQPTGRSAPPWLSRLPDVAAGLTGVFIFFNAFPGTTSVKEIGFYGALAVTLLSIAAGAMRPVLVTRITLPLALFSLWALVTVAPALDRANSLGDWLSHLLRYLLLYLLLVNHFATARRLAVLSWTVVISTTVFCLAGALYYYGVLGYPWTQRFVFGLFPELPTNLVGGLSVFAILLALRHLLSDSSLLERRAALICLAVLLAVTLLTQARGTFIALPVAITVMLSGHKRLLAVFLALLLLAVALSPIRERFDLQTEGRGLTDNIRLRIHRVSLEIIKDHPLTGIGFGMQIYGNDAIWEHYNQRLPPPCRFSERDKIRHRGTIFTPHNMLLSVAVRTGLIGLVLLIYLLGAVYAQCWKAVRGSADRQGRDWGRCVAAALTGFLVIGLFEPVFNHIQETVLFTIFALAAIVDRIAAGSAPRAAEGEGAG